MRPFERPLLPQAVGYIQQNSGLNSIRSLLEGVHKALLRRLLQNPRLSRKGSL